MNIFSSYKTKASLVGAFSALILLAGCQDTYSSGGRAVDGGLIGGGAGAAIGALAGGGRGAAIGALSGGLLGAATGAVTTPNRPSSQGGYENGYPSPQYNNTPRCQNAACQHQYTNQPGISGY
ncbi:YMGG-like glycine zipper-containing protein [Swingsia samuiensis]|uniref:YMGG-like glycine zipper-containing protein n=1 Tax=Swingsia samuiensis TaxID=1293412 RepID=UPI001FE5C76F|nr:YMGG-like glycine zipper-containing protein [Swingsia samuiensis]